MLVLMMRLCVFMQMLTMRMAYGGSEDDDGGFESDDGDGAGTGPKNGDDDTAGENVDGLGGGCVEDDVGDGDD